MKLNKILEGIFWTLGSAGFTYDVIILDYDSKY